MGFGGEIGRIFLAAIPVTAMLFTEVVLSRSNRRRDGSSRRKESDQAQRDVVPTDQDQAQRDVAPTDQDQAQRDVAPTGDVTPTPQRRKDDRYFQGLCQSARSGSLSAMNKLGEFAFVRKNFVEAFYWKLMLELRHGRPSALPAQGVCRFWQDIGCPKWDAGDGGSITEDQARLAMAALDLWSGRHVRTPREIIRQMVEEGDRDALLCARFFGIKHTRS